MMLAKALEGDVLEEDDLVIAANLLEGPRQMDGRVFGIALGIFAPCLGDAARGVGQPLAVRVVAGPADKGADRLADLARHRAVGRGFDQVADAIWAHLAPKGVAVVIEASHACMTARGVQTPGVMMTTSRMMGTFRADERSRREVLALMGY